MVISINCFKVSTKLHPFQMFFLTIPLVWAHYKERVREILATIMTPTTGEGVIPQHEYTRGEKYETQ